MSESTLEWGSATFFKVICRLGRVIGDTPDDTDSFPNRITQGGIVTIKMSVPRVKFQEVDQWWRSLSLGELTYTIQPNTGELVDPDGNVGAWLLNTTSAGIDPSGYTYEAQVKPSNGQPWVVVFTGPPLDQPQVIDLVHISEVPISSGTTSLFQRVSELETAVSSGGGGTGDSGETINWQDAINTLNGV